MRKITKLRRSIRAISPIISTLLLIAIAVVASLVAYAWVMGFIGNKSSQAGDAVQIQSYTSKSGNLTIYVQNTGQNLVHLKQNGSVYVNNTLYLITQSPSGTNVAAGSLIPIPVGQTVEIVTNFPYNPTDYITIKIVSVEGTFIQTSGAAVSGGSNSVLTSLIISPNTASVTAGSAEPFTATAYDQTNSSMGTVSAVFSVNGTAISGGTVTENITGTYIITATYGGITANNSATLQVTVGAAKTLVISPGSESIPAGTSQVYSATAYDQYGNSLGDVTSTSTFSVNGTSISGSSVNETTVGTYIVTANYSGVTSNSATLQVSASTSNTEFSVTGFPSPVTAGVAGNVTVQAVDPYGNIVTSYSGTAHFTSSDSKAVLPADTTLTNGVGTFSVTLETAGTQSITATDTVTSSITGSQTSITVNPAAATSLTISPNPSTVSAGNTVTCTALAVDQYNNQWNVTASTSWAINASAAGSWSGNVYTSHTAGSWTITGTFSGIQGTAQLTVSPGTLSTFTVTGQGLASGIGTQNAGTGFWITINATDSCGNLVTSDIGTNTLTLDIVGGGTGTITIVSGGSGTTTNAFTGGSWTGEVTASSAAPSLEYIYTTGGGVSGQSQSFLVKSTPTGQPYLVFIGGTSQTLSAGTRSAVITVERYSGSGIPQTSGALTVNLGALENSQSEGNFYLTATGTGTTTSVTIQNSYNNATFYYNDTVAGTVTIEAQATGYTEATTDFTINPGSVNAFQITSSGGIQETTILNYDNFYYLGTATAGQSFSITITAVDQYGNPATSFTGTVTLADSSPSVTLARLLSSSQARTSALST